MARVLLSYADTNATHITGGDRRDIMTQVRDARPPWHVWYPVAASQNIYILSRGAGFICPDTVTPVLGVIHTCETGALIR
jgi:hypothetical protein